MWVRRYATGCITKSASLTKPCPISMEYIRLVCHRGLLPHRDIPTGYPSDSSMTDRDSVNQLLFSCQCTIGYKKSQAIQMLEHAERLDKFYPKCYNNSTEIAFSQVIQMCQHRSDLGDIGIGVLIYLVGVLFLVHSYSTIFLLICKECRRNFCKFVGMHKRAALFC